MHSNSVNQGACLAVWLLLQLALVACGDGEHGAASCSEGTCAAPPAGEGICYTPCRQSFTDQSGRRVECSAEGLLPGCLDGMTCASGTCVRAGAGSPAASADGGALLPVEDGGLAEAALPGACERDLDCPDFQACIDGRCQSNCEHDSDCSGQQHCFRKVCRDACTSREDSCPEGTRCAVQDEENGFCMPLAEPAPDDSQQAVAGTFELSDELLAFSSSRLTHTFKIVNHAEVALDFVVTKKTHTEFRPEGAASVEVHPMPWLALGPSGAAERVDQVIITVEGNGAEAEVQLVNEAENLPAKWEGLIEVQQTDLGVRHLSLSYAEGTDGRWAGTMYSFAQFGDENLEAWMAQRGDRAALDSVGNALVQRWGALRTGRITLDEFDAALTSTTTGSWKWPSIKSICPTKACYPYTHPSGYGRYSDDLNNQPVPGGVSELPIALDLKSVEGRLEGRIASSIALQYAGDPRVDIVVGEPERCSSANSSACLAFVDSFAADIVVGGRYATDSADTSCARTPGYALAKTPWLVPGFEAGSEIDPIAHLPYTYECRSQRQPLLGGDAAILQENASLASANPIRDGRRRERHLELVDGALVNQSVLYLLVRETFDANFLGAGRSKTIAGYAFIALHRAQADLGLDDFTGTRPGEEDGNSADLSPEVSCRPELVSRALKNTTAVTPSNAEALLRTLLDGVSPTGSDLPITDKVHYLCHTTGRFDQGPGDESLAVCPAGSGVTYFTGPNLPASLAGEPCQTPPADEDVSCQSTLDAWRADPTRAIEILTIYRCREENRVLCDDNRLDLSSSKDFFRPSDNGPVFVPLQTEVDEAFRYKTRFRNREGTNLGFAPEICVPHSNVVPYCYDPSQIEQAEARVDCINHIYRGAVAPIPSYTLGQETRDRARAFLDASFSYSEERSSPRAPAVVRDGFERLHSELLIMLGDDAYTRAFQSRFDLAGSSLATFEGTKFEPGGIDLGGVAGYEMYTLYQAAQYYQYALDRFFALAPSLWTSIEGPAQHNFVSHKTVVSYLARVLRASTQKSRVWSEVAKRYQALARPELARFVIERGFTAAYLESVAISQLMQTIAANVAPEQRAEPRKALEDGSLTYRVALAEMRELHGNIRDDSGAFGFAPDYVPFPVVDEAGPNAFETLISLAGQASAAAAQKEDLAVASTREFETDSALFQSELARLRSTYENQLAEVCGTFEGDDGAIYPAIPTYAHLNAKAKLMGDPCGLMGTGSIHESIIKLEAAGIVLEQAYNELDTLTQRADDMRAQIAEQCMLTAAQAVLNYSNAGKKNSVKNRISAAKATLSGLERTLKIVQSSFHLATCVAGVGGTDCPSKLGASLGFGIASAAIQGVGIATDITIAASEAEYAELERADILLEDAQRCQQAKANGEWSIKSLLLDTTKYELGALRAAADIALASAEVEKLRQGATRVMAEQSESQELAINVEAAKNDPNVRIYKNDAIINADRTFQAALRAAYQATKVFEYYTSQTYAKRDELALVRMVSRGDYNLEGYLRELTTAFAEFEESYGHPDTRVDIISLRDDVLQIPRVSPTGQALSESERVALFREAISDTRVLDAQGYITIPFATDFTRLSPLTRNHKLLHTEVEVVGASVGDTLGRIYLGQSGTGAVHALGTSKAYYRFPARVAVMNPFFNGVRVFAPEVYRSERLRDLPYVNTRWTFVLNQRDETANQDIALDALSDVRLFVYYSDFTQL